ncbi:MAG: GAF domain-containing protein [Cyanobacteria bacterium REEB67]|nr:GAF domain-containing protein [Cyanobacteria bacterium REEB67]
MPSIPPGEVRLQAVDLTNCDKEQIHIPEAVQSFGALLAFDDNNQITRISANLPRLLGTPDTEGILGCNLSTVFEPKDIDSILKASSGTGWQIYHCVTSSGLSVNVLLHDSGRERYIDLIPVDEIHNEPNTATILLDFVSRASKTTTVLALAELLARTVRSISKFDRVKVYKFDKEWNGEVIAENRDAKAPSYLGLHFPQSDIPKQARELYQRNKVRVIANVDGARTPLISNEAGAPLDLSFSFVRSVSEIHLQYLRNMGVAASMSLSIFNDNKFWGLVACHHYSPRTVTFQEAALYEALSDICSGRLADLDKVEKAEIEAESLRNVQEIAKNVSGSGKLQTLLQGRPKMQDLIESTAAIICLDGQIMKTGAAPDDLTISKLVNWLERGREDIVAFDDLPERFSEEIGAYACGLLAASLGERSKSWIIWLRFEITKEVNWAGDPYKPAEETPFGTRLYPRSSFELWKEVKRGTSAPWLDWESETAKSLSQLISRFLASGQVT